MGGAESKYPERRRYKGEKAPLVIVDRKLWMRVGYFDILASSIPTLPEEEVIN